MTDKTKFFLFNMINGKKKLGYGNDHVDAYNILALRLTDQELSLIIREEYIKIPQRDLQKYVNQLG